MSLESQVAALVSAANKLTSEVANKMRGIDEKVDKAVGSVPDTIRDLSGKRYHIDAINGNDSADGSPSDPIQTAREAARRAIPGALVELYFKGGQDHFVRFNQRCAVRAVGWNHQELGKARLHPSGADFNQDTTQKVMQGFVDVGPYVTFGGVSIITGDAAFNPGGSQTVNSFYSAMIFGDAAIQIFMNDCTVELDSSSFTSNWAGYSQRDISMNNTVVERKPGSNARLMRDRNGSTSTLRLSCNNVTLKGDLTWPTLVPVYNNGANILANIEFS
ncbi:hypothetical protein [Vreelandella sp. EE27]